MKSARSLTFKTRRALGSDHARKDQDRTWKVPRKFNSQKYTFVTASKEGGHIYLGHTQSVVAGQTVEGLRSRESSCRKLKSAT